MRLHVFAPLDGDMLAHCSDGPDTTLEPPADTVSFEQSSSLRSLRCAVTFAAAHASEPTKEPAVGALETSPLQPTARIPSSAGHACRDGQASERKRPQFLYMCAARFYIFLLSRRTHGFSRCGSGFPPANTAAVKSSDSSLSGGPQVQALVPRSRRTCARKCVNRRLMMAGDCLTRFREL